MTRPARALALCAWAVFFLYLWLADKAAVFVGPRTAWVVPFGAICLTLVALGYLATVRRGERLRGREVAGLAALCAPVLCALMIPNPTLGAFAVDRKANSDAALAAASREAPDEGEPIDVFDIAVASVSLDYATKRGITDGTKVKVRGLVSDPGRETDPTFKLSRFRANCCAADAIPYTAIVAPGDVALPEFETDDWLEVTGVLARQSDGAFWIVPSAVERVGAPSDPYS